MVFEHAPIEFSQECGHSWPNIASKAANIPWLTASGSSPSWPMAACTHQQDAHEEPRSPMTMEITTTVKVTLATRLDVTA